MTAVVQDGKTGGRRTDLRLSVRDALTRDAAVGFPWVATILAVSVLATSVLAGSFAHEVSPRVGAALGTGWPSLRDGRWWTLGTSFVLTRDWFMATTMPVCVFVAVWLYERRAGHLRALTVAFVGHVTCTVIVALAFAPFTMTTIPMLTHAANNVDYGGSMAIAAAIGALLASVHNRTLTRTVIALALAGTLAHHQMSDWGHVVALPAGYWIGSIRGRRDSLLAGFLIAGGTVLLALAIPTVIA